MSMYEYPDDRAPQKGAGLNPRARDGFSRQRGSNRLARFASMPCLFNKGGHNVWPFRATYAAMSSYPSH